MSAPKPVTFHAGNARHLVLRLIQAHASATASKHFNPDPYGQPVLQRALSELTEEAQTILADEVRRLGGNAVVNFRVTYATLDGEVAVTVYGTIAELDETG